MFEKYKPTNYLGLKLYIVESADKLDVACYQAQAAAANYNYLDPLATKIPIPLVLAYQYHSFGIFFTIHLVLPYSFLWHFPTQSWFPGSF